MEKVVGPVVNLESAGVRSAHAWMAIDLVDNATGNPFNEFWDHTTEETKSQVGLVLFVFGEVQFTCACDALLDNEPWARGALLRGLLSLV